MVDRPKRGTMAGRHGRPPSVTALASAVVLPLALVPILAAPGLAGPLPVAPSPAAADAPPDSSAPASSASAAAQFVVGVRSGVHPGFGRIVLDCARGTGYSLVRDGDRVILRLDGAPPLGEAPALPRNVRSISTRAGIVEMTLAAGAPMRAARLGNRIVIDISDPPAASLPSANAPAARPAPPSVQPAALPQDKGQPAASIADISARPPDQAAPSGPHPGVPVLAALDIRPGSLLPVLKVREDAPPDTGPPPGSPPQATAGAASALYPAEAEAAQGPPPPAAALPGRGAGAPADRAALLAIAVRRLAADSDTAAAGLRGPAILVPFGADVGIAAFREGDTALLVFDERRPLDLAPLRGDPVFGGASARLLAAGTLLAVPMRPPPESGPLRSGRSMPEPSMPEPSMAENGGLVLERAQGGWIVRAAPPGASGVAAAAPIRPVLSGGRLVLPSASPGMTVTLSDPQDGSTLLVGTLRGQEGGPPMQGVAAGRQAPGYLLRPSWVGVIVEALSDRLALHPTEIGFALSVAAGVGADADGARADALRGALGAPGGTAEAASLSDAATLSRRYDFPPLDAAVLQRRLREQTAGAAAAPPLGRGEKRRMVAQTMLALGLGVEAQGVLADAVADDPKVAADPDVSGLAAIAALVAGRTDEAGGLADPRLDGTDEITLWRAVRDAQRTEASPVAAAGFAATLRLALSYPPGLAAHVLPLALETMVAAGEAARAAPVLAARKDDPALALARADAAAVRGDVDAALSGGADRQTGQGPHVPGKAALRGIDLRLASDRITPTEAAARLDRAVAAWRGDWRERAMRERLARVQVRAGAWAAALAPLRETEVAFPDAAVAIHVELVDTFAEMLRRKADTALPPLDLVALIDRNADLVPDGPAGDEIARLLADRLSALDLPQRAGTLLDRLMRASRKPATRADLGAALAEIRLRDADPAGALLALDASGSVAAASTPASASPAEGVASARSTGPQETGGDVLDPDLRARRALLAAEAKSRTGDLAGARAALDGIATHEAQQARAAIAEQAHDWAAAARSLAEDARDTVPARGTLTEAQQRALLRWANDASQANDPAALAAVRDAASGRMQEGPFAGVFGLLVADPARGVQDLARAERETRLARALPEQLKALDAPPVAAAC
jgi:hypothetical protein